MPDAPFSSVIVSVVLPVRNESRSIVAVLEQLSQQEFDPKQFEVIVADGGSTDNTAELARQYSATSRMPVRLVANPGVRSSAGRNAGVAAAKGRIILFLDGHCHLPSKTLLQDTIALLDKTGAECLCRPQPLIAPQASPFGQMIAAVRASPFGHGRDSLIYDMTACGFVDPASSGATYLRTALDRVGVYDERFDACEDVELNTRVRKTGMRAYTHPSLAVYYEPRSSLRGLWKQMVRYGRGRIRLAGKHPDSLSAGVLAPLSLLLVFAGALASPLLPGIARWTLLGLFACYLIVAITSSGLLARQHGWRILFAGPVIYSAIYLGLAWGMVVEAFSLRWKVAARSNATQENENTPA